MTGTRATVPTRSDRLDALPFSPQHRRLVLGSGVGWALGVGRLGGIAGPALGGSLLAFGLQPNQIFLCACIPALIAATASIMLTVNAAKNSDAIAPVAQPQTA